MRLLKHLDTQLDAVNPGACDLLRSEGVDPVDAAFKLSIVLPSIISVPFNSSASANAIHAAVADIADAISGAAPATITKQKEEWLKKRSGTMAAMYLLHRRRRRARAQTTQPSKHPLPTKLQRASRHRRRPRQLWQRCH